MTDNDTDIPRKELIPATLFALMGCGKAVWG